MFICHDQSIARHFTSNLSVACSVTGLYSLELEEASGIGGILNQTKSHLQATSHGAHIDPAFCDPDS